MNWKVIGSTGIFFLVLYFFGGILQAIFLIPSIAGWVSPLGINKHFAFALAVPIFFWFNIAVGKIFSFHKMNRIIGLAMILFFFFSISLFQGFKTQGNMFDMETGIAMQVYVKDPITGQIRILPPDMKFDPITGQRTTPVTPEILKDMEVMKRESWKNGGLREMNEMYRTISE